MLYTVSAEGLAQQALDERVGYYKTARPHQALEDATPVQRFHPAIGMETVDLCEWARVTMR